MTRPVSAQDLLKLDTRLRVECLQKTERPNQVIWQAGKQDYSEGAIADKEPPPEDVAGKWAVDTLLGNDVGHYGVLEHPQITLNIIGFPHSVMQQARTHRVGVTFDCQSMRYTGKRIQRLVEKIESPDCIDPYDDILDIFYTRPPGFYTDRKGAKYEVSNVAYKQQLMWHSGSAQRYNMLVADGYAEEHARDQLNFGFRQNFVVSFNLRSALHFLDLRAKRDAQLEIQAMCAAMLPHLRSWSPEIMDYYMNKRYGKARLSP